MPEAIQKWRPSQQLRGPLSLSGSDLAICFEPRKILARCRRDPFRTVGWFCADLLTQPCDSVVHICFGQSGVDRIGAFDPCCAKLTYERPGLRQPITDGEALPLCNPSLTCVFP